MKINKYVNGSEDENNNRIENENNNKSGTEKII